MDARTPAPDTGHITPDSKESSPPHNLPTLRRRRKPAPALAAPRQSGRLLVRLAPQHTALFRFLLEAYDHTAYFTVLEPKTALLKIIFSPHLEKGPQKCFEIATFSVMKALLRENGPGEARSRFFTPAYCGRSTAQRPSYGPPIQMKADTCH